MFILRIYKRIRKNILKKSLTKVHPLFTIYAKYRGPLCGELNHSYMLSLDSIQDCRDTAEVKGVISKGNK